MASMVVKEAGILAPLVRVPVIDTGRPLVTPRSMNLEPRDLAELLKAVILMHACRYACGYIYGYADS